MASPAEFSSDGCTGFPEVWRGIDLFPCCRAHDLAWFLSPGDWGRWFGSNLELGGCFIDAGAWELGVGAVLLTSTVGALMFAGALKLSRARLPPGGRAV